jgi:PIN domain nuclease of toxin-antitoxin system
MSVLMDTHVLLWWQAGGDRLSRDAVSAVERADSIYISPLTFWEVATLRRLGRIELDRDTGTWVHELLRTPKVTIAHLSPEAAAWAGQLPGRFPGDPIDRLLYATSRDLRVPFLSKDDGLRAFATSSGEIEVVW